MMGFTLLRVRAGVVGVVLLGLTLVVMEVGWLLLILVVLAVVVVAWGVARLRGPG